MVIINNNNSCHHHPCRRSDKYNALYVLSFIILGFTIGWLQAFVAVVIIRALVSLLAQVVLPVALLIHYLRSVLTKEYVWLILK